MHPEGRALYEMNKKLSYICAEMHTHGFHFDRRQQRHIARVLRTAAKKSAAQLWKMVGCETWRPTAHGMRGLIFKSRRKEGWPNFGLPDPLDEKLYTEGDDISVNHNALLTLIVTGQADEKLTRIIEQWWRVESTKKALSTFVESDLVSRAIWEDGKLRPGWNSLGTDTGRFSCSDPNVMNILQSLRRMYRASPGNILLHADKSSFEVRVLEAISDDAAIREGLAAGDQDKRKNIYTEDAREYFNLGPDVNVKKEKPQVYKASKIVRLASHYMAGTPQVYVSCVSEDRSLTYDRVQALHKKFLARSKGLVNYWHEEIDRVRRDGYSQTRVMKRRRNYPAEPSANEIVNYPVQGTAADIMNLEFVELYETLKRCVPSAKLVCQLHDAVDIDTPRRHRGEVKRIAEDVLGTKQYNIDGRVRGFPVEIKEGVYWNEV